MKYDLEKRLLNYAVEVIRLVERLPATRAGNHVGGQLIRSGTSPLFNHGEAESAESPKDFVHKLKICLKELRESQRALKLTAAVPFVDSDSDSDSAVEWLVCEADELIRIFVASIKTAQKRVLREVEKEYQT